MSGGTKNQPMLNFYEVPSFLLNRKRLSMKKALLALAALILAFSAQAQTKDERGFQFGINYRAGFVNWVHTQQSVNLSLGYRINRGNYLGVQSGYVFKGSTYVDADPGDYAYHGIPLMADYTHYFFLGKARRHAIYAGAEAGGIFANYYKGFGARRDSEGKQLVRNTTPVAKTIPYAGIKTGLDFNIADVTHLQVGITLNYIGFGVSAGLTF